MLDALTLDQLRVFASVAETGSFSAAARRLGRVQSAISQSVKTMESTLKLELFDRTAKMPIITAAGAALLREAIEILNDVDAFRLRAESISGGMATQFSLAIDQVVPNQIMIPSLKAFSTEFPLVPVTLYTQGLGSTAERLRSKMARLAIYTPFFSSIDGLEMEFLAKVRIVPVVAASHVLACLPAPISRAALRRHIQLALTDNSQSARGLILSSQNWLFADQHSRLDYLLNGCGWSFAPMHLVQEHVAAGRLKILNLEPLNGKSLSLPLYTVYLQGLKPDRSMLWLINYLRERLKDFREIFIQPDEEDDLMPFPIQEASF